MKIFITERDSKTNAILGLQRYDKKGLLEEADTIDPEIIEFYEVRAAEESALEDREAAIYAEQESSGLRSFTIAQANNFIDNQLDGATTNAQLREAMKTVLKKMIPFLLQ